MKNKHSQLSTLNSQLRNRRAISLIEVLAAIFVVAVGLLGVLAVVPYGMYQTKRAAIAEHGGNLGRATKAMVGLRGWDRPDKAMTDSFCRYWRSEDQVNGPVYQHHNTDLDQCFLNCIGPIFFDPIGEAPVPRITLEANNSDGNPDGVKTVQRVSYQSQSAGAGQPMTRTEAMNNCMGSDDLSYTLGAGDSGRTQLMLYDSAPLSKGDYSWFLTLQPNEFDPTPSSYAAVPFDNIKGFDVDVLVCYQRAPTAATDRTFTPLSLESYYKGGALTLNEEPDLQDTKYVFLVGPVSSSPLRMAGRWYRVVSTATGSTFHMTLEVPGGNPENNFDKVWGTALSNPADFRLIVIQGVINRLEVK